MLDVDEPDKFGKWLGQSLLEDRGLSDCLVSYHRQDSAEAVRSGAAKGKLIFRFAADGDHPLAGVSKSALRGGLGVEIFYGQGIPQFSASTPRGGEQSICSRRSLGPPPDWLITEITERAAKKAQAPRAEGPRRERQARRSCGGGEVREGRVGCEVAKVAAAPEGERNNGLFKAACRAGELVGAGALEGEVAEEALAAATTLPAAEASATIRNGLERGMACPRDLARVGRNGDGAGDVNEAVDDPHRLARLFRDKYCRHADGTPTIQYWQGGFLLWGGAYRSIELHEIHAHLAGFIKDEFDKANLEAIARWEQAGGDNSKGERGPKPKCLKVTRALVANTDLALGGYALLDSRTENPAWLIEDPPFPALEVLPTRNYLVHLPGLAQGDGVAAVREPHPNFFGLHALDYDFDPNAPEPLEWLRFLGTAPITPTSRVQHQLWPWDSKTAQSTDPESVATLQEFMGYLLTCDTSHHKILGLIGPPRCGKGTIARIIRALVGTPNVANPTLSSLGTQFGLQPLIGKLVALITDARLSGHTDLAAVVENLLSVSGEDVRTVDRKHLTSLTLRLYSRFVLISNEVPRLRDASGALASRMIILKFTHSFLGREDLGLTNHLLTELPGILNWAIEGWRRLRNRGHFVQPESGQDDVDLMKDLGSPVGAFVAEQCVLGPEYSILISDLYQAYKDWCVTKGKEKSTGDEHTFGRDLRAVNSTITKTRPGPRGPGRKYHYQGITLYSRTSHIPSTTTGEDVGIPF